MRIPTWLLAASVLACSIWGYVRLDLLETDLGELLEDPRANAGREIVAGYHRIVETGPDRFAIEVDGAPVVVHGRLPSASPGELASVRVRVLADGSVEALEIQEHRGRAEKVWLSALAALGLAVLVLAWVRRDPGGRGLTIRIPGDA